MGSDTWLGDFLSMVNAMFSAANIILANHSRKVLPLFLYSCFTNGIVIVVMSSWLLAVENADFGLSFVIAFVDFPAALSHSST